MNVDVAVIGGGLVGRSLALALARAGLAVVALDREAPAAQTEDAYDGRASAIAYGSAQVLRGIGLWDAILPEAAPILDIRVSDGDAPVFLHYDHRAVGAPFGWIVENRFVRRALAAATADTLTLLAPMAARYAGAEGGRARIELADGRSVRARVAVACDGRASPTRAALGIPAAEWSYGQAGIVCTIRHEHPHDGIAQERFLPAGPFAVLPLPTRAGVHFSSLVWTERAALTSTLMALPDSAFSGEIALRVGGFLGTVAVHGRRWAYPLGFMLAARYAGPRVALAGDAAHAIHPVAGQGFNLGLRDVAVLAECIVDAARLGLDIGAADVLAQYERRRRFDNLAMAGVTDGLVRLFSNDLAPLRLLRDLGLAAVERLPALKRAFMRHAMGLTGPQPRLARGLRL